MNIEERTIIEQLRCELTASRSLAKAEIDRLRDRNEELQLTMESYEDSWVSSKTESPRPAGVVRLPGGRWHLFEDQADMDRFAANRRAEGYALDAWNVSEWTWHGKEGARADDQSGR